MRITAEMVERAVVAYWDRCEVPEPLRDEMRAALEAALNGPIVAQTDKKVSDDKG